MSRSKVHFRGESFGASEVPKAVEDEYLKSSIEFYENSLLVRNSTQNNDSLIVSLRGLENEVCLLEHWNSQNQELLEIKDLELDRLNEDMRNCDEDLAEIDCQRIELEEKLRTLQEQIKLKDQIIERIKTAVELSSSPSGESRSFAQTLEKKTQKPVRNKPESPTLN